MLIEANGFSCRQFVFCVGIVSCTGFLPTQINLLSFNLFASGSPNSWVNSFIQCLCDEIAYYNECA